MKTIFTTLLLFVSLFLSAQTYNSPESAEYDVNHQRYIASNTSANNIQQQIPGSAPTLFKTGVTSPYGIVIVGDTVFVCAQSGYIKSYNLTTTVLTSNVNLGASFLNGICADDAGNIFASDFSAKKIYRYNIATQQFNIFCSTGTKTPNGILFDAAQHRLVMVTWGASASLQAISLADSTVTNLKTSTLSNFDGVAMDEDGNYYTSCWGNNSIMFFDSALLNAPLQVVTGLHSPADIFYNTLSDTLAVPNSASPYSVGYYGFPRPKPTNDFANATVAVQQSICVLQNDLISGNIPLVLQSFSTPQLGIAVTNGNCIDYTASTVGNDTITYVVCSVDTPSFCRKGILVVTNSLGAGNHAPVANNDTASTTQPNSISVNVVANDLDADLADTLCVTSVYGSNYFSLDASNCGNVIFTPDSSFVGNDTCWYVLCDNGNPVLCDTGMFVVMVSACAVPDFSLSYLCYGGSPAPQWGCYVSGSVIATGNLQNSISWEIKNPSQGFDSILINDDTLIIGSNPDFGLPPGEIQLSWGPVWIICATAQNSCGSTTVCDTITILWGGISEISLSNISLFPNPANNLLTIDMQNNNEEIVRSYSSIEIVNALGEKQKSIARKGTNKIVSLDVADLPNGIYLATIISDKKERRMLGKFTINR
ncbi:MAG: Ig-like domain-containing protein [Bacteroidetes bacterium]|nr:Ig-like domain-containing protein [Bacteroidota bacterium]